MKFPQATRPCKAVFFLALSLLASGCTSVRYLGTSPLSPPEHTYAREGVTRVAVQVNFAAAEDMKSFFRADTVRAGIMQGMSEQLRAAGVEVIDAASAGNDDYLLVVTARPTAPRSSLLSALGFVATGSLVPEVVRLELVLDSALIRAEEVIATSRQALNYRGYLSALFPTPLLLGQTPRPDTLATQARLDPRLEGMIGKAQAGGVAP